MHLPNKEFTLHSIMCMIGGYFGAYAIVCRSGNLGAAMTLNLIEVVYCLIGQNFVDFFLRIFCAVLYMGAILIYLWLRKKTHLNLQKYAILVDVAGLFLLYFIPTDIKPVIGLFPIFFMAATQWSVFHGFDGYNCSTIFSTNNLRQFTLALGECIMERTDKQMETMRFYGFSLLWYHVGAAISFVLCQHFGTHACLGCLPLTVFAYLLTIEWGTSPVTDCDTM
jgi:uncharacterized membrane protein YoaK (UPF0700 family)